MRSASNPGGVGHEWVKDRYITSHDPARVFIPAKIADNPFIDEAEYTASLMNLTPYERAQLLEGNWDAAVPGALFQRDWFSVIPRLPEALTGKVRFWDIAATGDGDYSVGTKMSRDNKRRCYVENVRRGKWTPHELDQQLVMAAAQDGPECRQWLEEQPGAAGKIANAHFAQVLAGHNYGFQRPTGDKVTRANPLASHAQSGNVSVLEAAWNREWFNELVMFASGLEPHDDQVDSAAGGFDKLNLARGVHPADCYSPRSHSEPLQNRDAVWH